jgi:hypothetical protein
VPGVSLGLERGVDALVGDLLAIVEALGVDAEQYFDAVPGPFGDAWRRHPGGQPQRYGRMAQVVGRPARGEAT